MKNRRSNWQILVSGILIFAGWFGALPVYAQTRQDGKGVGVKVVSELPSKEKRWALIVGIDEYQNDVSTLKGSVNDARALKNVLVNNAGFPENQIVLLTTDSAEQDKRPTRENILGALSDLYSRVPEDGLLLFSFSGHGISVGNQAFLIPSNGRFTKNLTLLKNFSIDVSTVKEAIQEIKVKQVLMLLDACRNEPGKGDAPNPLTDAYKNGFSFDVANSDVKAFATLYATSIGERAFEFYDKDTKQFRGYFSHAVEEALKGKAANEKGEVTLSRLIEYLETTVPQKVRYDKGETQIPTANYSETYKANQLVLAIADKKRLGTNQVTPSSPTKSDEVSFWKKIENSANAEDFENYLARCRRGEFNCIYKALAELKSKQLKAKINSDGRNTVSWAEMPVIKGKVIRKPDTTVFGESYPDSIYLPDEIVGFRLAKKYKRLVMKVGVRDNGEARGGKHFRVINENGILYEDDTRPNRRPVTVDIDISDSDVIAFTNDDPNGQPRDFVRYIDITFVVNPDPPPVAFNKQKISEGAGVSWTEMPLVKGKLLRKPDTIVFGEKYPNSIYLVNEEATFRTAKKYKKLIMMVGVQDNGDARGSKRFWVKDENGTLFESNALANRRPAIVEVDISESDLIGFSNNDTNGQPPDFIRYINVQFVPK